MSQPHHEGIVADTKDVVQSADMERLESTSRRTFDSLETVVVIIPTLNEAETIGDLIDKVKEVELPAKVSIFVIDGGSSDDTLEICKRKHVKFMVQRRKGKGNAMREAVDHVEAEVIVFIDGDGTYPVKDLSSLVMPLLEDKADMVVGSRTRDRRQKGSIVGFNALGNRIFNRAINFALKSSVTDSLSGYRALRRRTFKELILFTDRFEIEVEMTVEALARGMRILEVPIIYGIRKGSKTKLDPLNDGARIARSLLFILMNVNPLKFFGLISLSFFIVGSYPAYYVIHERITMGEIISIPAVILSSLLFVTGTISLVVGLLSELVVRSRRRLEYLMKKKFDP